MSKPKKLWWGYVRCMLKKWPEKLNEDEKRAVDKAICETRKMIDGKQRLDVINMVFFKKTMSLSGAANAIHCDYETAKRWQQAFIREVAKNFSCNGLK